MTKTHEADSIEVQARCELRLECMPMLNQTRTDATHDQYALVTYQPSGESRIEHRRSLTCSTWLTGAEHARILADPSLMAEWATDEDMDEPIKAVR